MEKRLDINNLNKYFAVHIKTNHNNVYKIDPKMKHLEACHYDWYNVTCLVCLAFLVFFIVTDDIDAYVGNFVNDKSEELYNGHQLTDGTRNNIFFITRIIVLCET